MLVPGSRSRLQQDDGDRELERSPTLTSGDTITGGAGARLSALEVIDIPPRTPRLATDSGLLSPLLTEADDQQQLILDQRTRSEGKAFDRPRPYPPPTLAQPMLHFMVEAE